MLERLVKYGFVGLLGFVVNLAVFFVCEKLGLHYLLCAVVAFFVSVSHNYLWNYFWTFKNQKLRQDSSFGRYCKYVFIGALCLGINILILYVLAEYFFLPTLYAQIIALSVGSLISFYLQSTITFAQAKEHERTFDDDACNNSHLQ